MPLVLITGGGSAIGEGIARCLAARGFTVAVTDIDLERARQSAASAGGPPRALALGLDATDRKQIDSMVAQLAAAHGGIDALVNVAGGMRGLGIAKSDFVDMTPALWTRLLDVNLSSVLHCTHAVLPPMIAARRGSIVSIAASRGLRGGPQASIYSAAKAAIIVFSQSLAQESGASASGSTRSRPAMRKRAGRRRPQAEARSGATPRATTSARRSRSCCRRTPRTSPAVAWTFQVGPRCIDDAGPCRCPYAVLW